MKTARIIDDDSRYYLVIENATDEDKLKVLKIMKEYFDINEEEKPEAAVPVDVVVPLPPERDPMTIGEFSSAEEFVSSYLHYKDFSKSDRKALLDNCRVYLKKRLSDIDDNDTDGMKGFITDFYPVFEGTINKILNSEGYGKDLSSFLSHEGDMKIRQAYDTVKETAIKNFNI